MRVWRYIVDSMFWWRLPGLKEWVAKAKKEDHS